MALTLVVENGTGLANATTYNSVAGVTARLAAVPRATAWANAALTADRQEQIAMEATAVIDRLPWDGIRTYQTQALAWPRAWMQTPDGYAIASNLMPAWLLDGHARLCEQLASELATLDANPQADTGLAPNTEIELASGLRFTPAARTGPLTPEIRDLFRPYLRGRGTLVRG